jgi:hypothetical protein
MATTTPNFGWPVPTSTDLVKDGATAIEALGDGIDTSMVDLKGGTTGQILAKATNADMDFAWITNDVGDITAITASSPLTGGGTSGDVTIGILSGTTSNLGAVQLSTSVSSTSTSLAATASAVKSAYDLANSAPISNPVINSAFQIAQRGTSFSTASAAYTLDRWYALAASAGTVSRQVTGDTTNLPNIQYCARFQRTSGSTSTTGFSLSNSFETLNSIPYAGKTVTLSFYARAGANYSPTSSAFGSRVWTGTGTDQAIQGTYTGGAFTINNTATLTTTWQRFSYSGALPAATTEMAIQFFCDPTGTAGANDYFEVTGVQIDIGSVALPFRTNGATIQAELVACRRYLPAITLSGGLNTFNGYAYTTNGGLFVIPFDTPARVPATGISIPTVTSNFTVRNSTNADAGATTLTFDTAGLYNGTLLTNGTLTAGTVARLVSNTSGGYILFTGCEL